MAVIVLAALGVPLWMVVGAQVALAGPSAAREAVMTASLGGVPVIPRDP
jgi:hypothetical protein